jgi:exosortase
MTNAISGRVSSILVLTLAAAVWAALLIAPLSAAWTLDPDLGHGWAAPFLIGYLFWERWSERPGLRRPIELGWIWWLGAAGLAAAALPLQLLLEPYPLWPALLWVYAALIVGAGLAATARLAGREGMLWVGGPLIVLAGALPWSASLAQDVIFPVREGIAAIAAEACNLLGRPALASGTTVRLAAGWVGIDEACGGVRSLQATVMIALFFGQWFRLPWRRRAALVGIGGFAALLGNFLRILFLALEAARGSAAFSAAHEAAGWAALAFSLAATGAAAWGWGRHDSSPDPFSGPPAKSAAVGGSPGQAGIWLWVVAGLFFLDEAAVRVWYARGSAAAVQVPHWTARFPESRLSFRPAPLDQISREMLRPDYYVAGSWADGGDLALSAYYIEWRKGSIARFIPFLHNPTVCLPMAGCELVESLGVIPVRWSGGEMPFHGYIFRQAGQELAVAFVVWDTARNRPLEKPDRFFSWSDWLRSQWAAVREGRRNQPAQLLSIAIAGKGAKADLAPALEALISQPLGPAP